MRILFTAGYGNSSPEDFLERLKKAGVTVVLDVRRSGSKSWNGKYNQGYSMRGLVENKSIEYWPLPYLSNNYDTLEAYNSWLDSQTMREEADLLSAIIEDDYLGHTLCILCAERDAYKAPHPGRLYFVVNCHRVYVADALAKLLGDDWSVKHI